MDIMLSIIKLCNDNNGFIMALLTFVYVIATILICIFNYKSAKEAKNQVETGNIIQRQNVDIQLFEMRKKLIYELDEALVEKISYFTKAIYGDCSSEKYEEKVILFLRELPYLFQKEDFEFVYKANECLNEIQVYLADYNTKKSEFIFTFFKDDYQDKLKKFDDSSKDFLRDVIDEDNFRSISRSVETEEMCECIICARKKHSEAMCILNSNSINNVFQTKYLSFK